MTTLIRSGQSPDSPPSPSRRKRGTHRRRMIRRERAYGARNYDPLPVVSAQGEGCWLADVDGRRYLDLMSAYSAVSFGHAHPRIVGALIAQAQRLARHVARVLQRPAAAAVRAPRAHRRDSTACCRPTAAPRRSRPRSRPRASGATRSRAFPTAAPRSSAASGNFHGRTITVDGAVDRAAVSRRLRPVSAGPVDRCRTATPTRSRARSRRTRPRSSSSPCRARRASSCRRDGYLARCAEICRDHRVLLICDEVQTGLGRTGRFLGCEHDGVAPDGVILGKALGGGLLPVSAFVATDDVMQVFHPGDHGSTFGGNPLAAAVAMAALDVLEDESWSSARAELGAWLLAELQAARQRRSSSTCAAAGCSSASRSTRRGRRRARSSIGCSRAASCRRTRTAPSCASRRRSTSRARISRGRSARSARSCAKSSGTKRAA